MFDRFLRAVRSLLSWFFAWMHDRHARRIEASGVAARRRELIDTVAHGASIAEIGAGSGATLRAGAYEGSAGRFSKIVLVEPDDGMRKRMEALANDEKGLHKSKPISIVDAALPNLPFADEEFDAVACFFVVSHAGDCKESVKELTRILKVGGKLLMMDHGAHVHGDHWHHAHAHGDHGHHGVADGNHESAHAKRDREEENHARSCGKVTATEGVSRSGHPEAPGYERKSVENLIWLKEWFRFNMLKGHSSSSVDLLLGYFREEQNLEEVFVSKMQAPIMHEACYGAFTRVGD